MKISQHSVECYALMLLPFLSEEEGNRLFEVLRRGLVFTGKKERPEELSSYPEMEIGRVVVMDGARSCCRGGYGGACSVDVRRME